MSDRIPHTLMVTGANRGLGLGIVRHFLDQNPELPKLIFATARNPESADELNKLAQCDHRVRIVQMEVTDDQSIRKAFDKISDELTSAGESGLNMLINNAAIMEDSPAAGLENADREFYNRHFDVNVTSQVIVIKTFLPLLRKAAASMPDDAALSGRRAAIVNLGSFLGSIELNFGSKIPDHDMQISIVYRLTKTAISQLSKTLAMDLTGDHIMSVTLHPGWVQTDMGGPNAPLQIDESTKAIVTTLSSLDAQTNGTMIDYDGKVLPY